jgi:ABC-type phosphate/phosphonate transport system substrate-binding protein
MSTRALALVLILTTSAFAGCTGGDPDAGGTDELDIEMIMDFLNNSSIEIANYNYYNNSTTNTYFVNGTNSVPTLHSLNGVISPSESETNIENYTELGFLVNLAQFPGATSPLDLDGANICVTIGSIAESSVLNF